MTEPTERCGFVVERSVSLFPGRPGAYRVSKDGMSNLFGKRFFNDINSASDEAFDEFMTVAIQPFFPHPFLFGNARADDECPG